MSPTKFFCYLKVFVLVFAGVNTAAVYADVPYLGEVRWFAGNFAPRGWAECNGQLLSVASYTALYSLLGTTYGGDGRTTFGVPDLRGRGMVHFGSGPGLTNRPPGQKSGGETVTLTANQLPAHTHTARADSSGGDSVLPDDRVLSKVGRLEVYDDTANVDMHDSSVATEGNGQAHNNMQPHIALTCIIALDGVYPPRSLSGAADDTVSVDVENIKPAP